MHSVSIGAAVLAIVFQTILPIFETSTDYLGLSIADPSTGAVGVTVRSSDGTVAGEGTVSIDPGGQQARLLHEVVETGAVPGAGWVEVESGNGARNAVLAFGDAGRLAMAAPGVAGRTLLLPDVRVATGFLELGYTDTLVHIVVPGAGAATVTLRLVGMDGAVVASASVLVPAGGSRTLTVSETFGSFLPDNGLGGRTFRGYFHLESDQDMLAWQLIETPLGRAVLEGAAPGIVSTPVMVPFFVFGGESQYRSTLNIINTSDTEVTLDLAADIDGGEWTASRTLAPGAVLGDTIQNIFGILTVQTFPPPLVSGAVRITSNSPAPAITGSMTVNAIGQGGYNESVMSYPVGGPSGTSWVLPFGVSGGGYFTGYAISNPNALLTVQTDVTIEVFAADGSLVESRQVSLSPRGMSTGLIPDGVGSGFIRISSNMPVRVVGSVGTSDPATLERVPAIAP